MWVVVELERFLLGMNVAFYRFLLAVLIVLMHVCAM